MSSFMPAIVRAPAGVLVVTLVAALAGCANPQTPPTPSEIAPGPGTAIEVTPVDTLSLDAAKEYLTAAEHDATTARFGTSSYKVVYRTADAEGESTQASGLLVLPDGDSEQRLHPVIYGHGTTSYRKDVASISTDEFTVSPGIVFASRGFAAIMPDYVGLGDSPGPHPYLHVPTQTSATTDMLTAVRKHLAAEGQDLASEVFVSGFSQGASTALGVGRALDAGDAAGFTLGGLAAISGAYSLREHQLPAMIGGEVAPQVAVPYTAFLLTSWDRLHGLYGSPAEAFRAPYADEVERLFSGDVTGEEMMGILPSSPDELLTDAGRALIASPGPAMTAALDQSDSVCRNWSPSAEVRLYFAQDDEQAVSANTAACAESFRAQGVTPRVVDMGAPARFESRHLGTQVAGTDAAADWFVSVTR